MAFFVSLWSTGDGQNLADANGIDVSEIVRFGDGRDSRIIRSGDAVQGITSFYRILNRDDRGRRLFDWDVQDLADADEIDIREIIGRCNS